MTGRSKIPRSATLVAGQRSSRHAAKGSPAPSLTPEDLHDHSKLGAVLDAAVTGNDNYRRLTEKILDAQDRLQTLCDEDAWIQYLHLEAVVNARIDLVIATVARFAFRQGRRRQRQHRGSK